jgi:nitrite reductase (NADH) small subunit/3-phenylpropionate/trans-cinnamate dioxygenase ferredoxin subunit
MGGRRLRVRNSPPIGHLGEDYAMPFLRTAKKDEIPPGTIREFDIDGKNIALANVDGKLFAINNICLHRGGPLGEGELEGQVVVCPWHGWKYDVTTGKLTTNPTVGVQCYAVEIRGDDIYVDLS